MAKSTGKNPHKQGTKEWLDWEASSIMAYCTGVVADASASTLRRDKMARTVLPFLMDKKARESSKGKLALKERSIKLREANAERKKHGGKKAQKIEEAKEVINKPGGKWGDIAKPKEPKAEAPRVTKEGDSVN